MNAYKIKHILLPYLFINIGFIGLYTLVHWFFILEKHLLNIQIKYFTFGIPFIIIGLIIYVFFRKKTAQLQFSNENFSFLFPILLGTGILIPNLLIQEYMIAKNGKLSIIDNISKIEVNNPTSYYQIKEYKVDTSHILESYNAKAIGQNNQTIEMSIFNITPFISNSDTTYNVWLTHKYTMTHSNDFTDDLFQSTFRLFADESMLKSKKYNLTYTTYFEVINQNSYHYEYYKKALDNSNFKTSKSCIFLQANIEPFEDRIKDSLYWIFFSIGGVLLIISTILFFTPFTDQHIEYNNVEESSNSFHSELLAMFMFRPGYFITPVILMLNILVFIAMVLSGMGFMDFNTSDLLAWGALQNELVFKGEWWRIISSFFMHGGIVHLLSNMLVLVFLGNMTELVLGKLKYLIFYFIAGVLGNLLSMYMLPDAVCVGASGAVFGMFGVFLAFLLRGVYQKEFSNAMLSSAILWIVINIISSIFTPQINLWAHLGGLVSGFVMGSIFTIFRKKKFTNNNLDN
jgi:rhomboid protease GluP